MKKTIMMLSVLFLSIGLLAACGSSDSKKDNSNNANKTTTTEKADKNESSKSDTSQAESKYPFPENASPTGKGKIVISTPSGTSENGNVPVLIVEPDTAMTQIGIDLSNFDGSKQTYIYINKIFNTAEQVGEMTQTSLNLEGEFLKPGTYTVTAIQFDNDDPKSGKVINYTEAKYEVKKGA
ncbi:hypothetical protein [Tuberibacillus calidus]|uniref:hypothetical protein n=1 Tax=Tuberibacillus calidus TaxID=340097 RepID=UPI0004809D60|nr:hypothetical protein [Tuberibacillus calidus]